jgi:hypothetical protein
MIGKLIAAGVILALFGTLLFAYGSARYDAGYQQSATDQRAAADEKKLAAEKEIAASKQRIETLARALQSKTVQLEKVKADAIKTDPTYQSWRATRVHPVARVRIWGVRDPPAGGGDLRTPGSGVAGDPGIPRDADPR